MSSRIFNKPALTLPKQIAHLRDHDMVIENEQDAIYWLQHVSYYRLSGYWLYFENPKHSNGSRFKQNITFNDVTNLYDFDRGLRRLIMRGTEHIEMTLRGSWAYELAQIGGSHGYLEAQIYTDRREFHNNFSKLAQDVGKSSETYIKHYRHRYDQPAMPPVWMVAEMMSFGQLSRWYSNLKSRALRNKIAEPFGLPETVFVSLIKHLTLVRNICAHHGRLWNRGFLQSPKLPVKPSDLNKSLDLQATQAPAQMYNTITIISFVLSQIVPKSSWTSDLIRYLNDNPDIDLRAMGFPKNWHQKPLWAKAQKP